MSDREYVIVVDEGDVLLGRMEKLQAHRVGVLHRAFSIMLGDPRGNLLLQRRDLGKYHCGGLWANSCCGHPRPGEDVAAAAERRLREELNVSASLTNVGVFRYRTQVGGGLTENEFVHLFHGQYAGEVSANPTEVMEVKWVAPSYFDTARAAETLAPWFRLYIRERPGFLHVVPS